MFVGTSISSNCGWDQVVKDAWHVNPSLWIQSQREIQLAADQSLTLTRRIVVTCAWAAEIHGLRLTSSRPTLCLAGVQGTPAGGPSHAPTSAVNCSDRSPWCTRGSRAGGVMQGDNAAGQVAPPHR